MCESVYHEHSYFLTITYDDDHLPLSDLSGYPTLVKRDIQLFNKRLRKRFGPFRFYLSGEYGPNTGRPHYHGIYFSLPIQTEEFVYYKSTPLGDPLYIVPSLTSCWSKGYVVVGEVTRDSCAYVARYTMKKLRGKAAESYYPVLGIQPEFSLMSNRPGIGYQFYVDNGLKIYRDDIMYTSNRDGVAHRMPIPRYFDKLLDRDDSAELESLKAERVRNVKLNEKYISTLTTLPSDVRRVKHGEALSSKLHHLDSYRSL